MEIRSLFEVKATQVPDEFIDSHMAAANGEYVKVYLYVLRHQQEKISITAIADALNHTESDVKRALLYWEKAGVLKSDQQEEVQKTVQKPAAQQPTGELPLQRTVDAAAAVSVPERPAYSMEQVNRLNQDEEFTQLLYIAQKYMGRIFIQRDMEVFAYLYDTLHMNAELLEYLVEYCVQGGHTSTRYVETVAISWHKKGFVTVEEARTYAESFSKNSFSVMRAFGLTDRKPGDKEKESIDRWFTTYGFSRELVVEACNRTMTATHAPNFQYAEKILSSWKAAGVKSMRDVAALDENHQTKSRTAVTTTKKTPNQFHNFEERDTDYDSMVLEQVKTWIKK